LRATQAHVDARIRVLDTRLTDVQADVNRKKLANALHPALDPKRLVKASKELDQLIGTPPRVVRTATLPVTTAGAADVGLPPGAPATGAAPTHRSPASIPLVRICPGGHYYHRPGCKRVQKPTVAISRAVAEAE